MKLEEAAELYGAGKPEKIPAMRRIMLSLEREKIRTAEQVKELCDRDPGRLLALRGIGPRSLTLIREILAFMEEAQNQCGEEAAGGGK